MSSRIFSPSPARWPKTCGTVALHCSSFIFVSVSNRVADCWNLLKHERVSCFKKLGTEQAGPSDAARIEHFCPLGGYQHSAPEEDITSLGGNVSLESGLARASCASQCHANRVECGADSVTHHHGGQDNPHHRNQSCNQRILNRRHAPFVTQKTTGHQ